MSSDDASFGMVEEAMDMEDGSDADELEDSNSNNIMMSEAAAAAPSEPANEEDAAVLKRRAIQAIMKDTTISDAERRMQIQNLMSGGRTEVVPAQAPVIPEQDSSTCVHYQRNCTIVAPCCNRVFGCRVCHDELSSSGHPPLDRFLIREVVCKSCNTRQSSAT